LRLPIDPQDTLIPNHLVLPQFITPPPLTDSLTPLPSHRLLPDDPFLVSYVAYHHFRSLGWVVKPGIKFSCDWLLYRRGPVFSHAA
jgi:tRNA-splicing endonuclease subunit Sen2